MPVGCLPDTRCEDARHLAERLRAAVAQRCGCTLGLGIADLTPHDDFASLVERADRAMLRTKRARDVSR
ncbi:hypothetical protein [Halomonas sp. 25-S5]|uniref:hypothetical protein n=1 Tax=Halomonas sp. 25-S5 TaxID=2994065 RepID=UPI002468B54E|nr:hypothetical protein [Halomonas sp. 25-S5]